MRNESIISIFTIILILFTSIYAIVDAEEPLTGEIKVTYFFRHPIIKRVFVDGKTFENIVIPGISNFGNPDEPLLPIKSAHILLPPNAKVEEIKVHAIPRIFLGRGFLLLPTSRPIPTYKNVNIHPYLSSIYSLKNFYPDKFYTYLNTYTFRGYTILVLDLCPIKYIPFTGDIFYYPSITVTVKTIYTSDKPSLYRGLDEDRKEVLGKIDNPDDIYLYSALPSINPSDQYDMLILTTDKLENHFIPLKKAHEDKGLKTRIKTLSDISIVKPTPEEIRDFLREEYINHGISYLLLGGDSDIVPAKMLYVSGLDENRWYYDTTMPSDLYYACLDGPYNYDGDSKWGEPNDGTDGGDVDLIAELYVGRACVDNIDDVDNFVSKTVSYMNTDALDSYLSNVLLAGEYLGDYGVASWGGNYLDQIVDGSNYDNYTTVGIPSNVFNITKMYDRDWPGNYWSPEELIDRINHGIHILNHDGHSYYGYNMRLTNSEVDEYLNNDQYFFDYSIGCMSGGFDNPEGYDCFAETLTVKTPHGAFAAIMNARYGFFWSYSTDGDSNRYVREFWDAVFGEHIYSIGAANQDSKEDNLYLINRSCMRWVYYETNLFGDPAVTFHVGGPPDKPTIDGPTKGKIKEEQKYTIFTTDPDGDNISYFIEFDDNGYWTAYYPSGKPINVTWTWNEKGLHTVRVKAKDESRLESEWSVLTVKMNSKTFVVLKIIKTIIGEILRS